VSKPAKRLRYGKQPRVRRDERVLDQDQQTVGRFHRRFLTEVADQPNAVGHVALEPRGEGEGDVVVAQVLVVGLDVAVAGLHVALQEVGEAGETVDLAGAMTDAEGIARHPIEAGEEGQVHVADVEVLAVLGGDADGRALECVVDPDAVLGEDGNEAAGDRNVERPELAGEPREDVAEVAFEEESDELGVELRDELVPDRAVEVEAREGSQLVERAQEGVDALGGGEVEVEVEVETGGDL